MKYEIGTLRSVLSRPSKTAWHVALKLLRGWPDAQEAEQMVLPYVQSVVAHWPEDLVRWAPTELVQEMSTIDRASVRGASLIQGISIHRSYGYDIEKMVSHGWFSPSLEHLEFVDRRLDSSLEGVLANVPNLTHLTLRGCYLQDKQLSPVLGLENLCHLDVSDNKLTNESATLLSQDGVLPHLMFLDIRNNQLTSAAQDRFQKEAVKKEGCEVKA